VPVISKIETNLPTEVLTALAEACGFRVVFDRSPGADEWTLSHGHGVSHVQHVGTRQAVCAFLTGHADMRLITVQILNDLDSAHRRLILDMRTRLES
jgi:hypothetical protein